MSKWTTLPKPVRGIIIGLFVGLLAVFLGSLQFTENLELYTLDLRYRLRPPIDTLPSLGYIDIDDASLRLFGQWPWPRSRHAVLVDTLNFYNAKAAAFDIFFIEREDTVFHPRAIEKILKRNPDERLFLHALDDSFRNYDEEFAAAMTKYGNAYLSFYTVRNEQDTSAETKTSPHTAAMTKLIEKDFQPMPKDLGNAPYVDIGIDPPLEEFIDAAKGIGFAEPVIDSDSIVRRYTLLRRYDGYLTYPLVLKVLSNVMDFKPSEMEIVPGKYLTLKKALRYGSDKRRDVKIPIDSHCQMLLNWAGTFRETYTHIPYETISYFSAVIRAKQIASKYNGDNCTELYDDIYANLLEEALVSDKTARSIAADIAAALFVSKYLDAAMTEDEILAKLRPFNNKLEEIYAVVTAAAQIEKSLIENRPKNPRPKNLIDALPLDNTPHARQIAEAKKNMKWFYDRNRLKDAYPYYFPSAPTVHRQGKDVAFSPVDLEGMIFLVGLTAANTIDLNPTPYEQSAPMVSFHLNALNSILTGQFLHSVPTSWSRLVTLILAMSISIIGIMTGVSITSIIMGTASFAYTFFVFKLWILRGYRMDLVMPLMGMALSYMTELVIHFVKGFLERKKVRSIFAKMVSPAVLKMMEDNPDSFSLTGRRKAAAVFFSTLVGMDEAIDKISPDELPILLGIYLSPNSEIIMHYGGYIDKYEGQVIMADFGAPIDDESAAVKCAMSAIEQRLDTQAFKFYAEAAYGISVSVSMGFNYGYVSAGNMGSEGKFQYTVMGDPVNVAARLMAANHIYNSDYAITGEDAAPVLSEFIYLRMLDKLLLKGKTRPLTIYECIGWRPEAYLKLHFGKPVPAHIKDIWMKCPTGKIFGYLHLWEDIFKKTFHPLAKTILSFFTQCLPVIEPLLANKWKGEALIFYKSILALKQKLNEAPGGCFSGVEFADKEMAGNIQDFLTIRLQEISTILEILADASLSRNLKEELISTSRSLLNRCEMLLSRLRKTHIEDSYLSKCTNVLHDFRPGKEISNEHQLNFLIAGGQSRYKTMVEHFWQRLKTENAAWHDLMSIAGSPTENELTAAGYFGDALSLYWQRHWDEAIAGFQSVLHYVPLDKPASTFIERINSYKENPPADHWQGEFIQTKK